MPPEAAAGTRTGDPAAPRPCWGLLRGALFVGFVAAGVLAGAVEWDSTAEVPPAGTRQASSTRRHGHAMILRAQPTQPQLTRWQLRQCSKKSTIECVKDNERENFNWEKHLMMSDYLMSPQNFSHVLMLDADAALVQPSKDTLRDIANILEEKGVDLFMTNEDWLLYGENRINGGLMMAKNTNFTRNLFQDTFDAHIQGPKKFKNWRIGVDLMECSSNEQICLNELWSGTGKAHFAHRAMMASGKRYNRGAERGIDGLGVDHIADPDVELMHWMGGSKGTAGRALCRGRGGDLTGDGPNGYGCRD